MRTSGLRWLMAAVLVGAGGTALAADPLREAEISLSLRAEELALDQLVATLKGEVRESNLRISDRAKVSWQLGVKAFDEVRMAVDRGEVPAALALTGPARALAMDGAREAFSVRTSLPIHKAVKVAVDAVAPRLESLRKVVEALHVEAYELRWRNAKETYENAKRLAAVDDYLNAWPTLVSAADQIDQLALETVFANDRVAAGEPSDAPVATP